MEGEETLILDASVLTKWFVDEEDSDKSLKIRDYAVMGKFSLIVPDLIIYEVANALRYSTSFDYHTISNAIISLYDMGLNIIEPQPELVKLAIGISLSYKVSVYDAIYIALSEGMGCPLITADEKFVEKVKDFNVTLLKKFKI